MMDIARALDQKRLKKAKDIKDKEARDAALAKARGMVSKWDERDQTKEATEVEVTASPLPKHSDKFIARWEAQLVVTDNEIERAKLKARIAKRQKQLDKKK